MTKQDSERKKNYSNIPNLTFGRVPDPKIFLSRSEKAKRIKKYYERTASERDEAKTNIPMKINGLSMEEKFKEKTIAKVKDMISATKRDKEKVK